MSSLLGAHTAAFMRNSIYGFTPFTYCYFQFITAKQSLKIKTDSWASLELTVGVSSHKLEERDAFLCVRSFSFLGELVFFGVRSFSFLG